MKATDLLREYGAAIRGDWGSIDGRSVRNELDYIADLIESGATRTADEMRNRVGVCLHGGGHWQMYCDEDCGEDK